MDRNEYILIKVMSALRKKIKDTNIELDNLVKRTKRKLKTQEPNDEKTLVMFTASDIIRATKCVLIENHIYLKRLWCFYRRGWFRNSKKFNNLLDNLIRDYKLKIPERIEDE